MLIGSHFLQEASEELSTYTHRFQEGVHALYTQKTAIQLAMLFSHDEIWEKCSYGTTNK